MVETSDVVVTGHLCLDLIPRMRHVPLSALSVPGRLSEVGALDFSTGGAVSNTGLALHRLGVNVRLMAAVGDDLVGRMIIAFLNDRDPALGQFITVQSGQASGYTIVLSPENVDRLFLTCPCIHAEFGLANLDFSLVSRSKVFHLGYPPILPRLMVNDGDELEAIYRQVKATGVVTSLDTSLPDPHGPGGRVDWRRLLSRTLPYVDIFVPSIEEILFMLRRSDYDLWRDDILSHLTADYLAALADELRGMGAVIVGFKLGEMGLYLQASEMGRFSRLECLGLDATAWVNARVWSPAYEVNVAGTTGAGDSAYAGLLAAMLRGASPQDAVHFACAVGGCNVEAPDATSGVKAWEETQARIEAGWPFHNRRLTGIEPC